MNETHLTYDSPATKCGSYFVFISPLHLSLRRNVGGAFCPQSRAGGGKIF